MIKGSDLVGRTVVDMEAATRLGKIKESILERDGERVAGFVVAQGETIVGTGGTRRIIPASALHAIGPDAITVRASETKQAAGGNLDQLPRMSDIIGRKMVTRGGKLIGSIDEILISGDDGKVIGFAVGEGIRGKLENVFSSDKSRVRGYVRADADLQFGNDLIVVPDDALVEGEPVTKKESAPSAAPSSKEHPGTGSWSAPEQTRSPGRSIWSKRPEPLGRTAAAAEQDAETPTTRSNEVEGVDAELHARSGS